MILKLKSKLFGSSDKRDFYNTGETAIRDLVKILVMGNDPRNANNHWVTVASNSILGVGRGSFSSKPKMYAFLGVSIKEERSKLKGMLNLLLKNSNESSFQFIERIWKEVADQKDKGMLKYQGMIDPNPKKEDILSVLELLRFIALCLTGQAQPEDFNWDGSSLRTLIDFNSRKIDKLTVAQLSSRLKEIISSLKPGINLA